MKRTRRGAGVGVGLLLPPLSILDACSGDAWVRVGVGVGVRVRVRVRVICVSSILRDGWEGKEEIGTRAALGLGVGLQVGLRVG